SPFFERQARRAPRVKPADIEGRVAGGPIPDELAVEDDLERGQTAHRVFNGGHLLTQAIAAVESDVSAIPERQEADAIQLALEDPVGSGEPLLRERRGHGHEPVWEGGWSGGGHGVQPAVFHILWKAAGPPRTKNKAEFP